MGYRDRNIPIEIFRTIIAIVENGSLTKAGSKLGLSQPAVSSQIKRIERIVGGSVFQKTANGSSPTELGKIVISQARKILDANDQTLALGGVSGGPALIRIGLSNLLVRQFMESQNGQTMSDVQLVSDSSSAIAKSLIDQQIDIACLFDTGSFEDLSQYVVDEFDEQLIWVRSRGFVLSPGTPIPIITWSGDDWITSTLARQGLAYRIAFNGQDFDAKKSAVEAGLGITAIPQRLLPKSLIHAKEYYLPKLPVMKVVLCVRPESRSKRLAEVQKSLSSVFFDSAPV